MGPTPSEPSPRSAGPQRARPAPVDRAEAAPLEPERAKAIRAHLEGLGEEMTRLLARLVEVETPTRDAAAQDPLLRLLAAELESVDFTVCRTPSLAARGHLLARPRARRRGRPYQLLLGHCDTVWAHGTLATMPVRIEDGLLKGPGAFDMKGGLVQMLFALRALHDLGLDPSVTPVVFVNSDEERGSPASWRHIERLARGASRSFVMEPALGLGGALKTARKGVGNFVVRVVGKSAHGGLEPQAGASAILELTHVIQALYALADAERGITVNVGQIEGGTAANVVAPAGRAVVDVRVPTRRDARALERAIRALEARTPGTRLEIEGEVGRPPMERTPRNRALWEAARDVGRTLGLELAEGTSGGGSDGNITSQYTATLDGLGPVGDGAHADHEFVVLDRMPERAALLACLLLLPTLPEPIPVEVLP